MDGSLQVKCQRSGVSVARRLHQERHMNEPKEPSQSGVLIVGVGASRGLGAAIARRFARGGHPVTIAGRNAAKLEATAAELEQAGANVTVAVGDASSAEDVRRFVAEADRA